MPIRVKCESCKKTLSVKDHLAGKKIKCPVCQNLVVVSAATGPKEPPAKTTERATGGPAGKKPAVTTKPIKAAKPAAQKPQTNGTPAPGDATHGNGSAAKQPGSTDLPPE